MTGSLFVFRGLVVLAWIVVIAIINIPPPGRVLTQDLWVKTFIWIPITLLYSVALFKALWIALGSLRQGLLIAGGAVIVTNLAFDYFIIGWLLRLQGTEFDSWTSVCSGLLYVGSLVAGASGIIVLISSAIQRGSAGTTPSQ